MIENLICSFLGTVAFSVVFNVHHRFYFWCGLTGMSGFMSYYLLSQHMESATACFFGTLVIVLLARIFAVRKKCPITVFLVSGIFPLVPGAGVYHTAYYFVMNDLPMALEMGIESVKIAFAIVLGIVFVVSLPKEWFRKKTVVSE